jgi:hypothetical protein
MDEFETLITQVEATCTDSAVAERLVVDIRRVRNLVRAHSDELHQNALRNPPLHKMVELTRAGQPGMIAADAITAMLLFGGPIVAMILLVLGFSMLAR